MFIIPKGTLELGDVVTSNVSGTTIIRKQSKDLNRARELMELSNVDSKTIEEIYGMIDKRDRSVSDLVRQVAEKNIFIYGLKEQIVEKKNEAN